VPHCLLPGTTTLIARRSFRLQGASRPAQEEHAEGDASIGPRHATVGVIHVGPDPDRHGNRIRRVRAKLAVALVLALAVSAPASVRAKGFSRVVLVGSDGRSVDVTADESVIDGLLSRRGPAVTLRGGYLRLFFVGPGDFPANPARYYPQQHCVALDWPKYEVSSCSTCPGW
jgi:hypothetical protein